MHFSSSLTLFAGVLAWSLGSGRAQAADDRGAEAVAQLRMEVDELAHRLAAERQRARDALTALRTEKAELERQLRLERIRRGTIARIERERESRKQSLETESERRLGPLRRAVALARAYVDESLPFRAEARRRQLRAIETSLAALRPDPSEALARLFRFLEEEEALTREVGLFQQPLALEGNRQLVDVVRIGMALMYFRTVDGRWGWIRPQGEKTWGIIVLRQVRETSALRRVFDALERNRAFGRHRLVLPSTLLEEL